MKQLKESILDNDFDINLGFVGTDFINSKVFENIIQDIEAYNCSLCMYLFDSKIQKAIKEFEDSFEVAGLDMKMLTNYIYGRGREYVDIINRWSDEVEMPSPEQKWFDKIVHCHDIDEFMNKNTRNWKNQKHILLFDASYIRDNFMLLQGETVDFGEMFQDLSTKTLKGCEIEYKEADGDSFLKFQF